MSRVILLDDLVNIASITWGLLSFDLTKSNPDTGSTQVAVRGPMRRTCAIVSNEREEDPEVIAHWRALQHAMNGQVNRLAVWDFGNPEPRGTARGEWRTAARVPAGASSMLVEVSAGQNGRTLLIGDWIGVGQDSEGPGRQLLHVQASTVVAGNQMAIEFAPPLRLSVAAGAAVVWDRPSCLMRRTTAEASWKATPAVWAPFEGGHSLDLAESWE
ncbi:hypothetical protein [Pseudacidovorax intermedius]|uniref:Uncharacterized protein n=1 Tax=Pseudacidovorax intermedius TaxID=433924 RepID=A0A147H092_9BURK|nr:hypothetical protein [Pseudacidovorax intermedius]KTT23237.1 hypothetical protein NS331_08455 [Pseudacidovorax intermedius]